MNSVDVTPKMEFRWRLLVAPFASAAAGFLVITSGIHLLVTNPIELYAQDRSEKLEMLKNSHEAFGFVVFGSSHAHNGFDPRAFDKEIQDAAQARSLNLAVRGGSQTEQAAMARHYLQSIKVPPKSPHATVLMLEANAGVNFQVMHLVHPRTINIYNKDIASLAYGFNPSRNELTKLIGRSGYALIATSLHYMNVGMLASQIFNPPVNKAILEHEIEPYSEKDAQDVISAIANKPNRANAATVEDTKGLAGVVKIINSSAATKDTELLFYITPKLSDLITHPAYPPSMEVDGKCIQIINFAIPNEHPELYKAEYWHDPGHLNEAGAGLFSSLLAKKLKELATAPTHHTCKVLNAIR